MIPHPSLKLTGFACTLRGETAKIKVTMNVSTAATQLFRMNEFPINHFLFIASAPSNKFFHPRCVIGTSMSLYLLKYCDPVVQTLVKKLYGRNTKALTFQ